MAEAQAVQRARDQVDALHDQFIDRRIDEILTTDALLKNLIILILASDEAGRYMTAYRQLIDAQVRTPYSHTPAFARVEIDSMHRLAAARQAAGEWLSRRQEK